MPSVILGYATALIIVVCATVLTAVGKPVPAELWTLAGIFGGGGLTVHGVAIQANAAAQAAAANPPAAAPPAATTSDPAGVGAAG